MAEGLVQEVFLKVWRSSGTIDSARGSFSTWLYRVTRSVALDLYRKRPQVPPGIRWAVAHRCLKGFFSRSSRGRRRVLVIMAGV
jgi:DNA-directed RNA polymerase specialized sigma24 family protein